MAKWTPDQLSMFRLWTSEASTSAISLPGLAGGAMHCVSQDGQTVGPFGLDHAHANRSQSQAKEPVQTIQGICGPTFIASSVPSGPLWYWENRLRERLATVGSTEFALIWKEKATPAGAPISQLSRSTPRTFASASTGLQWTNWPTPTTRDSKGQSGAGRQERKGNPLDTLPNAIAATWPTPRTTDQASGRILTPDGQRTNAAGTMTFGANISDLVHLYAIWPTPTKADGDGGHVMGTASATGRREDGSKITVSLPGVVKIVSTWPTPRAVDGDKGSRTPEGCEKEIARKGRLDDLPSTVMHNLATWPTPLQQDCRVPATPESAQREWDHSNLRGIAAFGTTTSGSPDQTGNRGALNPAFPCWLMGYPTVWDDCAPTAMPSSRRSRQK